MHPSPARHRRDHLDLRKLLGRAREGVAVEDEIHDTSLRACVLESLRAIQFPTPDPPGFVEAQLPVILRPDDALAQRAVCR